MPGTRIIREWKGKVHEVTIADCGFDYEGEILEACYLSPVGSLGPGLLQHMGPTSNDRAVIDASCEFIRPNSVTSEATFQGLATPDLRYLVCVSVALAPAKVVSMQKVCQRKFAK